VERGVKFLPTLLTFRLLHIVWLLHPLLLALAKRFLSADFDQPLWTLNRAEKLGAKLEFHSLAARYHFRALSFLYVPVVPSIWAFFQDAQLGAS
jgi:hypothetical protein